MVDFKELLGDYKCKKDSPFIKRCRIHQGWWRTCVLSINELENRKCNHIDDKQNKLGLNFLSEAVKHTVTEVKRIRDNYSSGMLDDRKLYDNLLSSQPLCFNFFAELEQDKDLALKVLQKFVPSLTAIDNVLFEYAPSPNPINDNTAFDVCFIVYAGEKKGLLGLECKYTDNFSYKNTKTKEIYGDAGSRNYDNYFSVYSQIKDDVNAEYLEIIRDKETNQLFRNELIARSLVASGKVDFVYTGLFYHPEDPNAIRCGENIKSRMKDNRFLLINYKEYIESIQKCDLSWKQREWSMYLWARYLAHGLSEKLYKSL